MGSTYTGVVILVLASGVGRRFVESGGSGSKLDAKLGELSVLEHTLSAVRASGLEWLLVTDIEGGMGDTIAAGVKATEGAAGWLVLPADLPLISTDSLRTITHALDSCVAIVPHCHGRPGHPVGFRRECYPLLRPLSGADGAKHVVRALRYRGLVLDLPLNDIGTVQDIDTISDLVFVESLLLNPSPRER
nr:NTP transferase domain-containing protein [Herbaspirillum chlorophenolicum]